MVTTYNRLNEEVQMKILFFLPCAPNPEWDSSHKIAVPSAPDEETIHEISYGIIHGDFIMIMNPWIGNSVYFPYRKGMTDLQICKLVDEAQ